MAISKEKKSKIVEDLTARLAGAQAAILADYRGLSVPEITRLRSELRQRGALLQVVKNTLTALALERANIPVPEDMLVGPTAIAFLSDDVAGPAKVLVGYANEMATFSIKGGLLGSRIISVEGVSGLASLPPRDVLLAQAVSGFQAPLRGLVSVLSGPMRGLLYVLQARTQQLEEGVSESQ